MHAYLKLAARLNALEIGCVKGGQHAIHPIVTFPTTAERPKKALKPCPWAWILNPLEIKND